MSKCYDDFTKEELIKLLHKQDEELAIKKYGLTWDSEKEPEQVVLDCENNLPILKRIADREIKTDTSDYNILIEGDNYHALTVLNYTHKEKIDVIYIDPPYNTGNKDFKYNDCYVDKEDGYRHSKWLNFMEKRLRLAHNLLKDEGVIFISIDDNEQANLKLLCDKIFNENNMITNIVWNSKTGSSDATTIDTVTEYILVYAKNKNLVKFNKDNFAFKKERFKHSDKYENERGLFYPDNLDRGGLRYSNSLNYGIKCPDGTVSFPNGRKNFVNEGWTWKWSKEKVEWGIKNDFILFKKSKNKECGWGVYYKNYLYVDNEGNKLERGTPYKNIILDIKTGDGAKVIKDMFGQHIFKYSKPVELLKMLISMCDIPKDAIILDFMAGSGTTAQMIAEFNNSDINNKKNLKYILCTNNENKICTDVCYPRISNVINGYTQKGNGKFIEGLGGNLQYYKTDLIPVQRINKINDSQREELTLKAGEMIAIKENCFNQVELNDYYQIFENNTSTKRVAIYFREDISEFDELVNKLGNTQTTLYIFSYGRIDKKTYSYLNDNISIEDVPEPILEIYKEINLTLKD